MSKAANYAVVEVLRDGRTVKIRALRPEDRDELLAVVERTSTQSLFRRFFGAKRGFTEQEIAFFLDIDFVDHVALVAVVDEGDRLTIVGGGRYASAVSDPFNRTIKANQVWCRPVANGFSYQEQSPSTL